LRTPSSAAEAIAAGAAAMPRADHADERELRSPVNISRLSTHVCQTSRPDATARAPNETP
jgi:hypothetical protein